MSKAFKYNTRNLPKVNWKVRQSVRAILMQAWGINIMRIPR